jgi:predicted small secreted protein
MRAFHLALIALTCLLLSQCTVARGPGWTYTSLGTDTKGLNMSAQGLIAADQNQSKSVQHGAQAIKDTVRLNGMFNLGSSAIKELGNVSNDLIK